MSLADRIVPDLAGGTIRLTQSEIGRCHSGIGWRLARFHTGVLEEIYRPTGPDPVANAEHWLAERLARYPSGEFVLAYFAYPTLHDPIPLDAGGISSNARAARILNPGNRVK